MMEVFTPATTPAVDGFGFRRPRTDGRDTRGGPTKGC
jgi:hypothetical protein